MSCVGSEISARLTAARVTEAGLVGSGWFNKLDAALADKLQRRLAKTAVLHAKKDSMLLVDDASGDMLRIIDDLFPGYNRVDYTLYATVGSDIEALRSAIYTVMFNDIVAEGRIIHVGGFQDTHVLHGRHVHCEQTIKGPMEYARAIRRFCVRDQLYRNATDVKLRLGKDKLPWGMLKEATDKEHSCVDPVSCTMSAGYMVFDINVVPLCQQQVCASMMQHKCEVAVALVLVEENSLMGSSGYIAGSSIRAECDEASGIINYSCDSGGCPEFPPMPATVLREWLTTTARHEYGSTFFFEVVQHYGPFSKIQITRVPGTLRATISHRSWAINAGRGAGNLRVVSVPKIKDLSRSPRNISNYTTTRVTIAEKTYRAAHEYALSLAANDFKRGNIRRKLNELTNRVIVKGTAVEVAEPLHPEVADVVALELYLKCYVERYDTSQTFKYSTTAITEARRVAGKGSFGFIGRVLGKAMYAVHDWWSEAVTDKLREMLDHIMLDRTLYIAVSSELKELFSEHTTELRPSKEDSWLKAPIAYAGGYYSMLMSRWRGPAENPLQSAFPDSKLVLPYSDGDAAEESGRRHSEALSSPELSVTSGGAAIPKVDDADVRVVYHCRDLPEARIVPVEDGPLDETPQLGKGFGLVASESSIRADMGPDAQPVAWRAERVELVMALDDHEQHSRSRVDIGDFISVLNQEYGNCFPSVAAADMSADYDLAAHGEMNFTVNVPFLRMPLDNIVGSERVVFQSKLNGPNRPNAPSETRNLLTGVVKRNADPNVIKLPQDANISQQMWDNFLRCRCRSDVRELLAEYKTHPIAVAMPNLIAWAKRVGPEKVDKVVKLFEQSDNMMMEYSLSEFLLQFKGKVKPTLSANAHRAFVKFQTIMHYTTEINMFWSAMFSDLTIRYNSLLSPHIHIGVRGNDADKLDHIRIHHPWGDPNLVYVQLDMSEYDKSQDIRARYFFDIMHFELGLSEEYTNRWSEGQTNNVARSMALGMKLIVPLQMKSGIGTTLWGNTAYSQAIAAWLMPNVVYELGQGDDLYDVLAERDFEPAMMADKAAAVFNMPLKLIAQTVMPKRTGYFCGKFVVYDEMKKEVFMLPDPIKAIESLSRPITEDEAKFDEMYQSFKDRIVAWKSDFPTEVFDSMVSKWYEAVDLRATYAVDALVSAGKNKQTFRALWEESSTKVK